MKKGIVRFLIPATIVLAVIAGCWVYPLLPDQIASHWNAGGQVNGYMPKFWGTFLFPIIMAILYVLYLVIPLIDPMKHNIESFRKHYDAFWLVAELFFLYIFGLMIKWNFGYRFDFTLAIMPAFAVFIFILGMLMEKTKRNWFIGIRTPWTLSSDVVWDKTHRVGGKLFKIAAVFTLISLAVPKALAVWFFIVPLLAATLISIVYSYVVYRQERT